MSDETITIRRGLYETLIAAHKALIVRAGGSVEIAYQELSEASQTTCQLRYVGDKAHVEDGVWTFTVVYQEPPDEPLPVKDDDETHDV